MTHTYVILGISQAAYDEIKAKLEAADYGHVFHEEIHHEGLHGRIIDMHGIALQAED